VLAEGDSLGLGDGKLVGKLSCFCLCDFSVPSSTTVFAVPPFLPVLKSDLALRNLKTPLFSAAAALCKKRNTESGRNFIFNLC